MEIIITGIELVDYPLVTAIIILALIGLLEIFKDKDVEIEDL